MTRFVVRFVCFMLVTALGLALQQARPSQAKAAAALDDWPMFLYDVARSSFNPNEIRLSPENAANLKLKWKFSVPDAIAAQPIVVGDLVYVGAWDGFLYALDREMGTVRWKINLGHTSGSNNICYPSSAGITSAPHVVNGVLYIGGGDNYKYAIDAKSGTPMWRFDVGDNSPEGGAYNWDSPAVFNGKVYTGIASFCDRPFVQGKIWALDATTGSVVNEVRLVRDGELGGGIWTSPTIDPATGALYATTGSGDEVIDYAYCMIACDPRTLAVTGVWRIPEEEQVTDGDWSTTPTLFKHSDGRTLVGAAAKNGYYYVFDSARIGAGPLWRYRIAIPGECPTCGEGSIASSAYAYNTVYTAGGRTMVNGVEVGAAVRAHDPSTGAVKWERATAGAIFGSVVVANNLVAVTADMEIQVLDARTGARLWLYDTKKRMFAAPTIAGGVLYAADTEGNLYAFWAGPYPEPPAAPTPQATPKPGPQGTPQPAPPLPGESKCFNETGKCLRGIFLDYWNKNGGLERLGFPVTNELLVDGRVTQYTERARFEQHTENQPPYNVLLGRLGAELTTGRGGENPFVKTQAKAGQAFVPETGHNITEPLLTYWQANGGVPVFGYPLSEGFNEKSPTDGKNYRVQYFERQRLEYHPEISDPARQVLLGLLGVQSYTARYGKLP